MKTVCVLQHVEAEYLGLIEDHLEARAIRFHYSRPFVPGGRVPPDAEDFDGLIVLGAGPLGIVSGPLVPSLAPELRLTADFLARGLPVIGFELGAAILTSAAGGGAEEAPLRFGLGTAHRVAADALAGHLPERFPLAAYLRDRPVLPDAARILAADETGAPAVFQLGANAIGFLGHPGIKSAMVEDLIMTSDDVPPATAETLAELRLAQAGIAESLTAIMVGLIATAGWMSPGS